MDPTRFDALARVLAAPATRRRAFKLFAALGLGGVLVRVTSHPAAAGACKPKECPADSCLNCAMFVQRDGTLRCTCVCDAPSACSGTGIVGGGALRTAGGGEAHLALLATRTAIPDQPEAFLVNGKVRWSDPAWEGTGLDLESINVAVYGPLPDVEGGREAVGWMRTAQRPGAYPFVLRAVDAGPPGSGLDTVALWVGDAVLEDAAVAGAFEPEEEPTSGFSYTAEGALISGDLQLVSLASDAAAVAAALAATPAP